jgi:hypothetical protein
MLLTTITGNTFDFSYILLLPFIIEIILIRSATFSSATSCLIQFPENVSYLFQIPTDPCE